MPQRPAVNNPNTVRKDAFNINTKMLESLTAGASYTATEKAMLNEIKNLLIQLVNNGKGS